MNEREEYFSSLSNRQRASEEASMLSIMYDVKERAEYLSTLSDKQRITIETEMLADASPSEREAYLIALCPSARSVIEGP